MERFFIVEFEDNFKEIVLTYLVSYEHPTELNFDLDFEMRYVVEIFLETDEGKKVLENIQDDFNWKHAMEYIPHDFWKEYGFNFTRIANPSKDSIKLKIKYLTINILESLEISKDMLDDDIFKHNYSIEQILLSYEKLEDLCENLDTCFDLWDLGYTDVRTQRNYLILSECKAIDLWYQHKEVWKVANEEKRLAL